jgi:hypothetical protein
MGSYRKVDDYTVAHLRNKSTLPPFSNDAGEVTRRMRSVV